MIPLRAISIPFVHYFPGGRTKIGDGLYALYFSKCRRLGVNDAYMLCASSDDTYPHNGNGDVGISRVEC